MQKPVLPEWWEQEELRRILHARDIAALFTYLKGRSFSWSAIGDLTGHQASRARAIGEGRRRVTEYDVLLRICIGLQIPRHYMGLGTNHVTSPDAGTAPASWEPGADLVPVTAEPIDVQGLLGVVASISVGAVPADVTQWLPAAHHVVLPDRLTPDDVTAVAETTAVHRHMDAVTGGGACLPSALGYANWATQLLQVPCTDDHLTQQLRIVLAALHNLIGWLAHDTGNHDLARRHLVQSLVLARGCDHYQLLANTLYRLGRVSLHEDEPELALRQFGLSQPAAQEGGCHTSAAISLANHAWANALLGRADLARDSLTRAATERDLADPATTPEWAQFALAGADAYGINAVVHTALAEHPDHRHYAEQALHEAEQAIALRDPARERRSLVFDTISAGAAGILAGEFAGAGRYSVTAAQLARTGMRSARVLDRLDHLWQLASPHVDADPGLAEFGRLLRDLHARP